MNCKVHLRSRNGFQLSASSVIVILNVHSGPSNGIQIFFRYFYLFEYISDIFGVTSDGHFVYSPNLLQKSWGLPHKTGRSDSIKTKTTRNDAINSKMYQELILNVCLFEYYSSVELIQRMRSYVSR